MNVCSIARISSLRVSVVPATERVAKASVLSVSALMGLLTLPAPLRTQGTPAPACIRFHPISSTRRYCSSDRTGGPHRLLTHVAHGILTARPALASDAD